MEEQNIEKYIYSDSRRFELGHKIDVFTPLMFIELSQLELLKIVKCLNKSHSFVLSKKISHYLDKISIKYDEKIDYGRILPKKAYEVDERV